MKTNSILAPIILIVLLAAFACGKRGKVSEEINSSGATLFAQSCQTCHILPNPQSKSDLEWPAIVQRYGPRAKLNDSQISSITSYLVANN